MVLFLDLSPISFTIFNQVKWDMRVHNQEKNFKKYGLRLFFEMTIYGCPQYKNLLHEQRWKIDSPKYKITQAFFHEIWKSLEIIVDVDKDGKITKNRILG